MSQLLHGRGYTFLWMDWFREDANFDAEGIRHCCRDMTDALTNVCEEHSDDSFACHDMVVSFSPMFREYGLIIHDGRQSIGIRHCPWCGAKLPESLRAAWFDKMDDLGIESPFEEQDRVPPEYKSAAWWQKSEEPNAG